MPDPTISIIIVSYNTRDLTRQCLASLRADSTALDAEVVVVDNGSTDGTAALIARAFPEVRLLRLPNNGGFGAANNRGAAVARGAYLLLLNSDTIVPPGSLPPLLAFARAHPDAGAVAPRLTNPDGSLQPNCYRFPTPWTALLENLGLDRLLRPPMTYAPEAYRRPGCVDFASGACLLIPRAAFQVAGGFDEGFFMYDEETDFCRRLRATGKAVYYTPASAVVHLGGGSRTTRLDQMRQRQTSHDYYFRKHYGRGGLLLYRAVAILGCLLRLAGWCVLAGTRPRQRAALAAQIRFRRWLLHWHLRRLTLPARP